MVKVLNIISDTNIGGAGRVLLNYLKYRDRDEFDISVLVPAGSLLKPRLEELGARVYEAEGFADVSYSRKAVKILKQRIREIGPDIVHTHGSLAGRIAARQSGARVIYTRHSVFPVSAKLKSGPGRLMNRLINEHYADAMIAVSPAARDNLAESGIPPEKVDVIMNGVEPVERLTGAALEEARRRFGVRDGVFTAGILARFEEYKGQSDILKAVGILKDRGVDVTVLMAGAGTNEETIRRLIEESDLSDRVRDVGFVTDVPALLSVLDAQLNASWGTEATSLSLLEGMSMGLPAIVSDYGGNPYVIENGRNGLVFPARDARALADCMEALAASPEKREALSEGARRIYREKFTAEGFARGIENIYRRVMED